MKEKIKIYSVSFRDADYVTKNVSNSTSYSQPISEYIFLEGEDLLVREDQIEDYKSFGGGIETLRFVGYLYTKSVDEMMKESSRLHAEPV